MPADSDHALSPVNEMSCREVVDLITNYLDGAMLEHDRTRFEAHLDDCPGCTTYLDQLRLTTSWLGQLSEGSMPIPTQDTFLAAFRGWKRERS